MSPLGTFPGALRFGILGPGRIADTVAGAIRATSGDELGAIGSRDAGRARAFAAAHGVHLAFGDYAELAACPEVDVVYVATPPARHIEDVRTCLAAGKHVLCEKPFVLAGEDARALAAEAEARGLFLMEALWTRFLPATAKMTALLDQGAIGTPKLLVAGGAFQPEPDPGYYLLDPAQGGGVMRDAGVYLLHIARWVMGPIRRVLASDRRGVTGVDVQDAVVLDHEGGGHSLLYVSLEARRAPDLVILGDRGRISLGPPVFNPSRLDLVQTNGSEQSWAFASDLTGYGGQIAEVVACVTQGLTQSPRLPLTVTVDVAEALEAISPVRRMEDA